MTEREGAWGGERICTPHIFADNLILSQTGVADYAPPQSLPLAPQIFRPAVIPAIHTTYVPSEQACMCARERGGDKSESHDCGLEENTTYRVGCQ